MLMKVFNKGQVVIPGHIRKMLGIRVGDLIDIDLGIKSKQVKIRKLKRLKSDRLAGCFYNPKIPFPTKKQMHDAFVQGILKGYKP